MNNSNIDPHDPERIIRLSNDISELDAEYNSWLQNPYDRRKVGDGKCIEKYGCTNTELYKKLRAKLTAKETPIKLPKDFNNISESLVESDTKIDRANRIDKANTIMDKDQFIVIINDFIDDETPEYDMDTLDDTYKIYLNLSDKQKKLSSDYSMNIWGLSVNDMYKKMSAKLSKKDTESLMTTDDKIINSVSDQLSPTSDFVQYELARIDYMCKSSNRSLTESIILESLMHKKLKYIPMQTNIDNIVPFLTPDEYQDINGVKIMDPYDYIDIKDKKKYLKVIQDLQLKMDAGSKVESNILKLGWNPYVKITGESLKFAKQKQTKWFDKLPKSTTLDIHECDTNIPADELNEADHKLLPIFIASIIRDYKVIDIGIALDSIRNVQIFEDGLAVHNFYNLAGDKDIIDIRCFFVEESIYWVIKNNLDKICNVPDCDLIGKEPVYAVDRALILFTNSMNSIIEDSDSERYYIKEPMIYVLYHGSIYDYLPGTCIRKAYALTYCENKAVDKVMEEDLTSTLYSKLIENFFVETYRDDINSILSELRTAMLPKSVLVVNELRLPFGLDDKGLYINFPKDLQKEYEEAHRLLSMYGTNNMEGIKHELAHLYYINWVIEKKLKHTNRSNKKYKELIDLRARVLNDFKKYFKIVCAAEKDFDFMEYLKTTEYYTKRMEVDYEMLRAIGKIISQYSGH